MGKAVVWKPRAVFDWRFVKVESRWAYQMACILFWSILLYCFCQRYVVGLGMVTEQSMLPTLSEGEYFLINKYLYRLTRPRRGDVVVVRRDPSGTEQYVKRIIALEGDTLLIRSGNVYINGRHLIEPYAVGATFPDVGPFHIEEGRYFVLGDNRMESEDSRQFGPVALGDIEGKIQPGALFPFQ